MSIRWKIVLIVVPLILATLLLTGVSSYFSASNGITRVAKDFLGFKAQELQAQAGPPAAGIQLQARERTSTGLRQKGPDTASSNQPPQKQVPGTGILQSNHFLARIISPSSWFSLIDILRCPKTAPFNSRTIPATGLRKLP